MCTNLERADYKKIRFFFKFLCKKKARGANRAGFDGDEGVALGVVRGEILPVFLRHFQLVILEDDEDEPVTLDIRTIVGLLEVLLSDVNRLLELPTMGNLGVFLPFMSPARPNLDLEFSSGESHFWESDGGRIEDIEALLCLKDGTTEVIRKPFFERKHESSFL
jgi:hypothetical protein